MNALISLSILIALVLCGVISLNTVTEKPNRNRHF